MQYEAINAYICKQKGRGKLIQPVQSPNLPAHSVCCVMIGECYAELLAKPLMHMGIEFIGLPDNSCVDPRIRGHADMIAHHLSGNKFVVAKSTYQSLCHLNHRINANNPIVSILEANNVQTMAYPQDIPMNALRIGGFLFGDIIHTDVRILEYCRSNGIKLIHINQGYAKCSVCIVDERSVITSDPGIEKAMANEGFDVLRITEGYIDLPGYKFGFIGGASGKIAPDKLAFTGTLDSHPDCDKILRFIHSRSVDEVYLTNMNCFDVGSILPTFETDACS